MQYNLFKIIEIERRNKKKNEVFVFGYAEMQCNLFKIIEIERRNKKKNDNLPKANQELCLQGHPVRDRYFELHYNL